MHVLINRTRTYVVILNRHARGCICEKYTCVCKCIYTESLDMCACNFGNNLYMNHTGEVLPHLMPCGMQALENTIHRYSSTFPPRAFIKMMNTLEIYYRRAHRAFACGIVTPQDFYRWGDQLSLERYREARCVCVVELIMHPPVDNTAIPHSTCAFSFLLYTVYVIHSIHTFITTYINRHIYAYVYIHTHVYIHTQA
jgi:hypothetical protein